MLEFMFFCVTGTAIGLRFRVTTAIVLGAAVLAASIAMAIAMHAGVDARILSVVFSLLGFNLGIVCGLIMDWWRGQALPVRSGGAPSLEMGEARRAAVAEPIRARGDHAESIPRARSRS